MMKYKESIAQSAEYLRLVLPLMSKQAAAFHPLSYAIWYEYVAGINLPLKAAVDALTQNGKVLDETSVSNIFRDHIAALDTGTAQRVTAQFQTVLADMSQSATYAGEQANQFGSALEEWTEGLGASASRGAIKGIDKLLNDTRQMQGAISSLHQQLDDSKKKIEKLSEEVERAREDALTDGLTGLINRKGFDLALNACLSSKLQQHGPSLLIADIDHFKRINDSYGHLFGDKVIRTVAQVLKDNVKGCDTAARYGGEEFVILLPDTPVEGARILAEKIRSTIEKGKIRRLGSDQEIASVTVSFGVSSYCVGESANDFIARVDSALYASKNLGRNLVTTA